MTGESGETPAAAATSLETQTPDALAAAAEPVAETALEPAVVAPSFITVTVSGGDTLLGFALDYGVPMAAIQLQNDLGTSTMIRVGQELVIPPSIAWEGASPFWIVHVVSQGETLSGIASAYGLTLGDLQGANGLANVDLLSIGQPLVLPLSTFADARAVVPATPVPPAAAPPTAAPPSEAPPSEAPAAAMPTAAAEEPAAAPPTAVVAAPAPPPADVADWGRETVRIMNEVRAGHGLPPLIYNDTLAQAGQIQANDCAARGSCSHTGSDGSTIKDRVLRVGYAPASWAECWASRLNPQGAIDIWMNETPPNDPHRRTLLTTWLPEIGVGVAEGKWGYYFIAVFGRPLR